MIVHSTETIFVICLSVIFTYLQCLLLFFSLLQELLRHCDSASELSQKDLTEALQVLFQHSGVSAKKEELILLAEKISSAYHVHSASSSVSADSVMEFCAQEADRHEWTLVGDR